MTHHMQKGVAGALGLFMLGACSTPATEGGPVGMNRVGESVNPTRACAAESVAGSAVRVARDVVYVTRGSQALRLDVAWSDAGPPAPLVLLLHGGSWSGGSRTSMHDEMHALARRGYTAASVEYRLAQAPRNVFPAAAADVRCALRTLRRRAADYHIAPGRAAAMGYSAGGHLASLLGVGADVPGLGTGDCDAGGNEVRIQAVVSYAGPQDLRVNQPYTREQADLVTNFLGVFPGDDPRIATLASPMAHVKGGSPPFLFIHGTNDDLVPVRHPREMTSALRAVGTPATLVEIPGIGHGYVGMAASRDDRVRCTVASFLSRWLGASPS